jgi:hypothetical protein
MLRALDLPESTTTNPAPPITGMASCLTPAEKDRERERDRAIERERESSQVMGHSTAGSR